MRYFYRSLTVSLFLAFCLSSLALAQLPGGLSGLARIKKDVKSKRTSSYQRNGGNQDYITIKAGETAEIFRASGAGVITHIWVTINHPDGQGEQLALSRRNVILRMYWDGETEPSVQSPIGDFFGQGWGEFYNYASAPLAAAPGEGRAMVSYFPMPFGDGARMTIENDTEHDIRSFYYYVDYEQHASIPGDMGRFHAWWNHQLTASASSNGLGENEWETLGEYGQNITGKENYLFADIQGTGHFVGVNYYVISPTPMWYGEGDDMFFIDGEQWPSSLHGTGTEDYFNTSWCPKELYQHPYFGLARVNEGQSGYLGRTHVYRFHVQDPVRFGESLLASIEHGHDNCLTLDMASVAYWYQAEPHKSFPAMQTRQQRTPPTAPREWDMHRWRDAWRKMMGNGATLWGTEEKK